MFDLHPRLEADTISAGCLKLSRVLLMDDARFPWLILVPERDGMRDMIDLAPDDQRALWEEISQVSRALRDVVPTDKLNVAALGNMVPQLHVHIIARTTEDAAWPSPVWGVGTAVPYANAAAGELIAKLNSALGL